MKYVIAIVPAVAMLLGACAHAPPRTVSDGHPASRHPPVSADQRVASMDSRRDIVLAVANPISPPTPHAGSNLLGYAAVSAHYRRSQRAMSTLAALKQSYGLHEIVGWPIKALGLYCVVLRPAPDADRDALLEKLAKDDRVRLAEPLHRYSVHARAPGKPAASGARETAGNDYARYNDPYVGLQRGFMEIHAARAQRISQGEGVDIALVDTGVDVAHPDLEGRIDGVRNMVDDDAAAFQHDRHGTEVAGIIAANANNHLGIVGIAPEATLSIYKACWYPPGTRTGARCNTFTLAKALSAILGTNIRIINLSLGGPEDPLLRQLLTMLLRQDRIVVAAMPPNGNLDSFPAAIQGVIVVRSAQAPQVSERILDAPGQDILTTQPDGSYDFVSGSSMAAAHVSGIAALLLSQSPDLDARTVRSILQRSRTITDDGKPPLVDAAAAVVALGTTRGTKPVAMSSP